MAVPAALAVASCGTVASGGGRQTPRVGAARSRVVPWVNRPGRIVLPKPLPRHFVPATARPCSAADLRAFADGGNGAGGHTEFTLGLRNVGQSTCLLKGYPRVVATEPGRKPVVATDGGFMVGRERPGNMPPGGVTRLNLETDQDCTARYAKPGQYPTRVYHTVTVSVPGGGQVSIHRPFDVLCGLFTGQFGVAEPPQRYSKPAWTGVRVALRLPASAKSGTVLRYIVDLTNPTGKPMPLRPCPGYTQGLGEAGKTVLELNCTAVPRQEIPARQTIRFAMRIPVPAGTPTGPGRVYWSIAGSVSAGAPGSVRVIGHDTPCTTSQLTAAISGPGQVPGPPNLLGMKRLATAVPLTVTNISGQPCSVYGAPSLVIRSSDGQDLKLQRVSYRQYEQPPHQVVPTVVTLAPHTGTARTTLYWYLPWCGANPNPVTVLITLPANGARLTTTPAGGWIPPACGAGARPAPSRPGEVSADPFRAG